MCTYSWSRASKEVSKTHHMYLLTVMCNKINELLVVSITCMLGKWQTDLLGYSFKVWTDHKTLEHFGMQCNLSSRQARWMESLSQYDATIHYLLGKQNSVADALSQLPDTGITAVSTIFANTQHQKICLRFDLEDAILDEIKQGYTTDPFIAKLTSAATGLKMLNNNKASGSSTSVSLSCTAGTSAKRCSTLHTTSSGISEHQKATTRFDTRSIGQTCDVTLKRHIFLRVSSVSKTNRPQPNLLAHHTHYQYQLDVVTPSQSISLALYLLTMVLTASSHLQTA